jgi:hypothetical protein
MPVSCKIFLLYVWFIERQIKPNNTDFGESALIVIDSIQTTSDGKILIPPFHSGHLGLIPGSINLPTEVLVSLNSDFNQQEPTDCEVVFSPYPQSEGNMMQLSCTMKDEPGVVSRLVHAISELEINIATLQTSTIDKLDHHFVNMILDWHTSKQNVRMPSAPSVLHNFQDYRELLPIGEERYIKLFVSILARCGDVLAWEDFAGKQLPRLRLRPFEHLHKFMFPGEARVFRADRPPYHVTVQCPEKVLRSLKDQLGTDSQDLQYVLLSETEEGTLRAFFPNPQRVKSMIHIGFLHDDKPQALHALTEMVATASFNVVTSLLRKQTFGRSTWEALLEYRGRDEFPNSTEDVYKWACHRFLQTIPSELADRLKKFDIEVGRPSYPKPQGKPKPEYISLNNLLSPENSRKGITNHLSETVVDHSLLEGQLKRMEHDGLTIGNPKVKLVRAAMKFAGATRPTIFLSYPRVAASHAKFLIAELERDFHVTFYQKPDGEVITSQVIERIQQADFFIAIWHHEEAMLSDSKKFGISPWMHFEYGIAVAEGKPSLIVYSEKLDERVWRRINPEKAHPAYSDVEFVPETVPFIRRYCTMHFTFARDPLILLEDDGELVSDEGGHA